MNIPQGITDLSLEWLKQVFREYGDVSQFRVEQISNHGGMISPIARIFLSYDETKPKREDAPRSVMGKFSSTFGKVGQEMQRLEATFYQSPPVNHEQVPIPKCYFVLCEDDAMILLMEDFSGYHVGSWTEGFTRKRIANAMQTYARLHAGAWTGVPQRPNGVMSMASEMVITGKESLLKITSYIPTGLSEFIRHHTDAIYSVVHRYDGGRLFFHESPTTLVHGDAQFGNLIFDDEDKVISVIDWQVYTQAKAVYDLAYFLGITLPSEFRREVEVDALRTYAIVLESQGISDYDLQCLNRDYPISLFFVGLNVLIRWGMMITGPDDSSIPWATEVFMRIEESFADWQVWNAVGVI